MPTSFVIRWNATFLCMHAQEELQARDYGL